MCGWNAQRLFHTNEGLLENDRKVSLLTPPVDLELVRCSLDYEMGALLWDPIRQNDAAHVEQALIAFAYPDYA